jgi:hypothetical protein
LFVAQSWPIGADPTIFFTSIQAAINQGATMNPTMTNQVLVLIYPGSYTENLTLVSNVGLAAATPGGAIVQLNGNVIWQPGVGVNAPQTNVIELVIFNGITMAVPNTFTFDSTGKVSAAAIFYTQQGIFGNVAFTGRGINLDTAFFFLANFNSQSTSWTNMTGQAQTVGVELTACRLRSMTFTGNTVIRVQSGDFINGSWTLNGTANVTANGIDRFLTAAVGAGALLTIAGSNIVSTISVAAGGVADVRGSNYGQNANLVGPGTIDRTTWTQVVGPTAAGANIIPIANAPFPDGTYNVILTLTAGPGSAGVTVTGKTGPSFTINDPVGGNTFDATLIDD